MVGRNGFCLQQLYRMSKVCLEDTVRHNRAETQKTGNCENNVCPNRRKWYVSKSKALIEYKINKTPKNLKMWTEHSILVRTPDLN